MNRPRTVYYKRTIPAETPDNGDEQDPGYTSFGDFLRTRYYSKIFVLGMLIIFMGYMLIAIVGYMEPPDKDEYEVKYEDYNDAERNYVRDVDKYNTLTRNFNNTGDILTNFGIVMLVLALFIGAVNDRKLPHFVRMGMFIALGFIVAFNI